MNKQIVGLLLLAIFVAFAAFWWGRAAASAGSSTLGSYGEPSQDRALASSNVDSRVGPASIPEVKPGEDPGIVMQRPPTLDPAAALEKFQRASLSPWQLAKDPFTDRVRTLAGGALKSGGYDPTSFVEKWSKALFGVSPEKLKELKIVETDQKKVIYQQTENGVAVFGATLALVYEKGELVRIQNDLQPIREIPGDSPPMTLEEAFTAYKKSQPEETSVSLNSNHQGEVLLYPYNEGRSVYAYRFYTTEKAGSSSDQFEILFDTTNSHLIKKHSTHTF